MFRGLTLVELLVSIAMFSIFTVAVIASFVSFLDVQRTSQDEKRVLEEIDFGLDYLSRKLRFGTGYTVDGTGKCIAFNGESGKEEFIIETTEDADEKTTSGTIKHRIGIGDEDTDCDSEGVESLFTDDVVVKRSSSFSSIDDNEQEGVKIKLDLYYKFKHRNDPDQERELEIRTQITSRILEVESDVAKNFVLGYSLENLSRQYYRYQEKADDPGKYECTDGVTPFGELTVYIAITDEWDNMATYSKGDKVTSGGSFYESIKDGNTGNALTDGSYWKLTSEEERGDYTNCDKKEYAGRVKYAVYKNNRIYVLTENGLVYYLKSSTTDEGEAERVVGKNGSDACYGCKNDLSDITRLRVNSVDGDTNNNIYAISGDGDLYRIDTDDRATIINDRDDGVRIKNLSISNKYSVIHFEEAGSQTLKVYNTDLPYSNGKLDSDSCVDGGCQEIDEEDLGVNLRSVIHIRSFAFKDENSAGVFLITEKELKLVRVIFGTSSAEVYDIPIAGEGELENSDIQFLKDISDVDDDIIKVGIVAGGDVKIYDITLNSTESENTVTLGDTIATIEGDNNKEGDNGDIKFFVYSDDGFPFFGTGDDNENKIIFISADNNLYAYDTAVGEYSHFHPKDNTFYSTNFVSIVGGVSNNSIILIGEEGGHRNVFKLLEETEGSSVAPNLYTTSGYLRRYDKYFLDCLSIDEIITNTLTDKGDCPAPETEE